MSVCGILLFDSAFAELGKVIEPYVREGSIGKYIYCAHAVQNGNFVDMTFEPEHANGRIGERMLISVPVQFVKFMATGATALSIGFSAGSGN